MENRKVIVIGAGIGGIGAAYWASKLGYDVEVLDNHYSLQGLLDQGPIFHSLLETRLIRFYAIGHLLLKLLVGYR